MQKHENTLEFHSRLIEAAEVRFSRRMGRSHLSPQLRSPLTTAKTYLRG